MMKNFCSLACKFELDQRERKSLQAIASTCKSWPNGVTSQCKFSTCDNLRLCLARALHVIIAMQLVSQKKKKNGLWLVEFRE